jgi:hypothetical protein
VTVAPRMLRIDETASLSAWSAPRVRRGRRIGLDCRAESGRSRSKAACRVNPRKRRGPALGDRPSHDSTATTALDGPSVSLSRHWLPYQEDQFGDFCEPPETTPLCGATQDSEGCGCAPRYGLAA